MAARRTSPPVTPQMVLDGQREIDDRIQLAQSLRKTSGEAEAHLDLILLGEIERGRKLIAHGRERERELGSLIEQLTAAPWHTARFARLVTQDGWTRGLVACDRSFRLVEIDPSVDPGLLTAGATVFLSGERNVVLGVAQQALASGGETAWFERVLSSGRLIVKQRDEEIIVDASATLDLGALQPGDALRLDRGAWMALETIERGDASRYLVESPVKIGPEALGGQERALSELLDRLGAAMLDRDLASRYGVGGRCSVLLCGPPGCGKTLLTRIAAHLLDQSSERGCKFFAIKPGEFESPWVGETQARIRQTFEELRRAAGESAVVVFFDEADSLGRQRGHSLSRHGDDFANALLAELDGFQDRGDVAVVSATNRADLMDAALLQRLSDTRIEVGRPDHAGARSIFRVHLGDEVPVRPNGACAPDTREELIETAVSLLYAPNGQNTLARIHFRDAKARDVGAHELVSGRLIEQVCRAARSRAFARHVRGGAQGVDLSDMRFAVGQALDRLGSMLMRSNARHYLADLPEDVDIVRVERTPRLVHDEEYLA